MNFEQEIQAIENLTQSLRSREQNGILADTEIQNLRGDKEHYIGRVQELEKLVDRLQSERDDIQAKHEQETRSNGELSATLKQLLAEQMALASRAAEMLRSLEQKPEPMLTPRKTEVQIIINEEKEKKVLLDKFIAKDNEDLRDWPIGEKFVLDPPTPETIGWAGVKNWYRAHGRIPGNWKERPSIEFMREPDGKRFLGFILQKQEDREPIPFRKENENGNGTSNQTAFPPDDGQELPKFLTKPNGTTSDDDQGRKASDL